VSVVEHAHQVEEVARLLAGEEVLCTECRGDARRAQDPREERPGRARAAQDDRDVAEAHGAKSAVAVGDRKPFRVQLTEARGDEARFRGDPRIDHLLRAALRSVEDVQLGRRPPGHRIRGRGVPRAAETGGIAEDPWRLRARRVEAQGLIQVVAAAG